MWIHALTGICCFKFLSEIFSLVTSYILTIPHCNISPMHTHRYFPTNPASSRTENRHSGTDPLHSTCVCAGLWDAPNPFPLLGRQLPDELGQNNRGICYLQTPEGFFSPRAWGKSARSASLCSFCWLCSAKIAGSYHDFCYSYTYTKKGVENYQCHWEFLSSSAISANSSSFFCKISLDEDVFFHSGNVTPV